MVGLIVGCLLMSLRGAPIAEAQSGERARSAPSFISETQQAMDKMMAAMTIAPSGDADADFATMMIPHHQGAIDMAVAELRFGRNEQLRRLAQKIVVEHQQEIALMRLALEGSNASAPPSPPEMPGMTHPALQERK